MTKYRIILFFILLIGNIHVSAQTHIAGQYNRRNNIFTPIDTNITAESFSKGRAKFIIKSPKPPSENNTFSDQICGVLDTTGKIIIPAKYDYLSLTDDGYVIATLNNRTEVLSLANKVIIPPLYKWIYSTQNHQYIVNIHTNNGYGVVNIKNEIVIPIRFDSIIEFGNGYLVRENGEALYDSNGKMLVRPQENTLFYPPVWKTRNAGDIVFNQKTNKFIHYKNIDSFNLADKIIAYYRDNKWGLMDTLGTEVTKPIYEKFRLYYFVSDSILSSENLIGAKMKGKWGIIDNHGRVHLNFEYDTLKEWNGNKILRKNGKYGLLKKGSMIVTPMKYDEIYTEDQYRRNQFSQIIPVRIARKWGFLDQQTKEITSVKYDTLGSFNTHLSIVGINHKYGLIDNEGKEITPLIYDKINLWGLHDILIEKNDLYGLLHQSGQIKIPATYQYIAPLGITFASSDKYYYVTRYEKKGIIDSVGKSLVPCEYDELLYNLGDTVPIIAKKDTYYGLITWSGKLLTKFVYKEIFLCDGNFFQFEKDRKRGLLNLTGKIILPPVYDQISGPYKFGYFIFQNKKLGLLNKTGKILIKPKYDSCEIFSDSYFKVTKGNKVGLIDSQGRKVYPCVYKSIDSINGKTVINKFK